MNKINWVKLWPLSIAVLFAFNAFAASMGWYHLDSPQMDALNKFLSAIGSVVSGALFDPSAVVTKEDPN